jgi:general secretion pathway protein D
MVLITPHVVHEPRDARALTDDLRDGMINAARVPDELGQMRRSESPDPSRPLPRSLRLEQ